MVRIIGEYIEVVGIKLPFLSVEPALNMLFENLNVYLLTRYFECRGLFCGRWIKVAVFCHLGKTFP